MLDLGKLYPPLETYCPLARTLSPKQALFLMWDGREALYGGAVGGGKSVGLLAAALQYVDHPGYHALILRRTFRQLEKGEALIPLAEEWLSHTDAKKSDQGKKWRFPSGATLEFGHCENESDKYNFQGGAWMFIGFDELTQFPESIYSYIAFSRQRRTLRMAELGVPTRIRATGNPGGLGHGWVLKRFIKDESREEGVVFIPATVWDNPGLDVPHYVGTHLSHLPETLRKQLLEGDWGAFEGMAFPEFDEEIHCVPPLEPPAEWTRFESLDHGIANPTCVLAWAVDYDGNLIVFDSYYSQPNTLISAHAAALKAHRLRWWPKDEKGWMRQSPVCYADHDLWQRTGLTTKWGEPASLLDEYSEAGVEGFVHASRGRKEGRARVLELMHPDPDRLFPSWHPRRGQPGSPRLFIVKERCRELVAEIRQAKVNEEAVGEKIGAGEAVDPKWESANAHSIPPLRYGAMSWQAASQPEPEEDSDPRRAAFTHAERALNREEDTIAV